MYNSLSRMIKSGILISLCSVFTLFLSEWTLTYFFTEINVRTYAFFFLLYLIAGVLGGIFLGFFLKQITRFFKNEWWQEKTIVFMPAVLLFVIFFIYGFYYINEKLTAGVGLFAFISLLADFVFLVISAILFRIALAIPVKTNKIAIQFLQIALLPLILIVAVNIRFFAWQPPLTQNGELFFGVFSLGFTGLIGIGASFVLSEYVFRHSSDGVIATSFSIIGGLVLVVFVLTGFPSTSSFKIDDNAKEVEALPEKHPNIVWIVTDNARRDHFSTYGAESNVTPNIDEFSRDALVFDRAIATAPWTLPSHASMFTGMYPSKHMAHFFDDDMFSNPLIPENETIAEILSARGYNTAAIVANNAGLSRGFGCDQGFQFYFDARPFVFSLFWGKLLLALPKDFRVDGLWVNEVCLASEINKIVYEWLDQQSSAKPYFLFINYMEPHGGIAFVPEPFDSMFGFDREKQKEIFKDHDALKVIHFEAETSKKQRDFWNGYVCRKNKFMDFHIGDLFDNLKESGIYDDSIIILNSDHGELFGEHNSFGHTTDLYNELIWIPMMMKYPQSIKTGRSQDIVQTVDIMPEILSYLDIEISNQVQGQPFAEVLHPIVAELFQQQHNARSKRNPQRYFRDLRAIFSNIDGDSLKYIWSSNGHDEIFDLNSDQNELMNIVENKPGHAELLDNQLKDWLNSFEPISVFKKTNHTNSEDLKKRLRSLGYIK